MAAKKGEVYKCETCGNVVAVLQGGDGDLVCCGENMKQLSESEAGAFWGGLPKPGAGTVA
jgi:superoxide reductase